MDAYSWELGDGAASSAQSASHLYSAPGTYAVNLTVTKDSCSTTCRGSVTVKPVPDCSWTSNSPVCYGIAVNFNGPSGMDSYSWKFGDGGTSTVEDPSHTYSGPGTYAVNLTTTKDGCSKKCEGSVTVKPLPDCSWTSNSPVCYGIAVNFNGPSGMDSYSWKFGDGGTSTVEDPSHTYSGPGTYTVNLTTTKDGCSKKCEGSVTVKPLPDCSWTSNSPVCYGIAVNFNGPSGMDSYSWKFGDGGTSTVEDPSHVYPAPGTYTINLTVCKDGCCKKCEGSVTVKPLPDCSWTSNSPVCNGTTVDFDGPSGMDSYSWKFGDGKTSTVEDPSHTYSGPGTYVVNLTTTKDGCSNKCEGSVTVKPLPDCSWTSNSPVCNGTAVIFNGPSEMESYSWDFGDGKTSTLEDPSHTYSAPGTYTVKLTVSKNGCSKTCPGSVVVILADCNWTACSPMCNGTEMQFNAPSGMDTYLWDFGDGSSSTEEDPSHLYPAPGAYTVTLAVTKGTCSDTCEGLVEVITCPPNPPEYNSTVSYEDLLKSQYELITSFGNLLKNTTLKEDRPDLYSFLESFDDLAHRQKKGIYSYEDLVSHRWPELSPQQKIELTDSFETLLRQAEIILSCEEDLLKRDWCKLSPDEQQHFLDKFEDDLHYQQMLLLKFEDWLHNQQTMEDCYKKWWLRFLASFKDLIWRQSNLLDSFEMLMKIDCSGEYINVIKSANEMEVDAGAPVKYTYTISAKSTYSIKNVVVKDSLWGEVGTIALLVPGTPQTLTVTKPLSCADCNNCECKVCNFATVCGEVITVDGNFTVCDVSNEMCVIVDENLGVGPIYPGKKVTETAEETSPAAEEPAVEATGKATVEGTKAPAELPSPAGCTTCGKK
jgi:PKD repeat protein